MTGKGQGLISQKTAKDKESVPTSPPFARMRSRDGE